MDLHKITLSEEEIKFRYLIQDVIDRVLYCPEYKEQLIKFNKDFEIPKTVKISYGPINFKEYEKSKTV